MADELTRIFSDLHFGDRASRVHRLEQLRPLCDGVGRLVLNGDTLDTRPGPAPQHTAECRAAVLEFFPREAGAVTYVTGNHDADLSETHSVDLAGGLIFATHGDIIFDNIVPWSRDATVIGEQIAARLQGLSPSEPDDLERRFRIWRQVAGSIPQRHQAERQGSKHALRYLADTLWPPTRFLRILRAWQVEPGRIAALARRHRPQAKFVVAGHLHRPGVWRQPSGTVVINTGSFCPPLGGYAIDLWPGRLVVRQIDRRGGEFHPGEVVGEFPLAER